MRNDGNYIVLAGRLQEPGAGSIKAIKSLVKGEGWVPFLNKDPKSPFSPHILKIGLFKLKTVKQRPWLNILLFGLTFITTALGGALLEGADVFSNPLLIWKGLPYALAIILILGSHELGHFLTCRHYGMQATPPFFIPFLPPFGTMGAVIRMGLTPNRRALIRVGAAGPIVGFLVAIPVTIIGLKLSSTVTVANPFSFGESLIFRLLEFIAFDVFKWTRFENLHPIVIAGQLGFLVTSLNLLPLSQLDGGHIAYGLFGKKRIYLTMITYAGLAATAFLFRSWNWLVWGAVSLAFGFKHPPAEDEISPAGTSDILIAVAALIILILTVVPVPLKII